MKIATSCYQSLRGGQQKPVVQEIVKTLKLIESLDIVKKRFPFVNV